MEIGKRMKSKRKELQMSLQELGEFSGLTASFLSQIENDQVSPSLNSLQSIASALNVPIFYLLTEELNGNVVRAEKRKKFYFPNTKIGYEMLTEDITKQMISYYIRLKPHMVRIAMPLPKPTEQWMYVVRGKLKIVVGDETFVLDVGDTIYYDGDLLTEFSSVSDEELEIICCITPPAL